VSTGRPKKSKLFNSILTNLEHGLNHGSMCAEFVWISASDGGLWWTFRQSSSACARISLCARIYLVTSARPSTQNGWGAVRLAYCGELFTHHDTSSNSSSHCCMVAALIVSEYICKHISTLWVCAFIPNYSPSRWSIECVFIPWERKWQDKTILMTEVIIL
jgi:hypothetical protein